jgi:hypothetical protein
VSLAARLIHSLAIVTPRSDGTADEYNHPAPGEPLVEPVAGLVQPRKARDIALSMQQGAELADYRIYMLDRPVPDTGAWISDAPDDIETGRRYDIVGVEPHRYGRTPHLEINARLVTSTPVSSVGGGS